MPVNEPVDVIIYRVRDTGLEVFLPHHDATANDPANALWQAPTGDENAPERLTNFIELDPLTTDPARKTVAIEADWHELPSLRALMYEDYRVAKEKAKQRIKSLFPDMEKGAFVAVKDAFKRVMPEQYAYLKELKDIVTDKNQTKYI